LHFEFKVNLSLFVRQRISYAKTKSWATLKRENPNFIPPNFANAPKQPPAPNGTDKRGREAEAVDNERAKKREKASHDDDDAEEMEIDEDEEQQANS
jgi:U2 small nuclear ribonucleoprotein B''